MNISLETLSVIGMWLAQLVYVFVYIPQIITNFKNKTGHGLSDLMLLGYFNALVAVVYYVFSCNLPLAYRLLAPIQIVFIIVLIGQRLIYDKDKTATRPYWFLYGGNMMGALAVFPLSINHPLEVGIGAGWTMFVLSLLNQMPQVMKIFREKSVAGFSIFFALLTLMAGSIEFLTALVVGLPIQTLLSALRGVLFGLVWLVQFKLYR